MPNVRVCTTSEVPLGQMKACTAEGTKLVVYHLDDGWYATQASCTHVWLPLAKGSLEEHGVVTCPAHRARFDVRTGAVIQGANWPLGQAILEAAKKAKPLTTYPVTVDGDDVLVHV